MVGKPPSVCFARRLTNTDICCKLTGHAGHHENECGETWPPDNIEAIEEFIVKLRKSARKIEKEITECIAFDVIDSTILKPQVYRLIFII